MQVQRTLVKSPPELWAELSDVEALTRHLARFGEIRITRVEPETKVAWEGEHASGTVELTASGWGTKVTLTAEPREAGPPAAEAEPAEAPEPEAAAAAEAEAAPPVAAAPGEPAPEPDEAPAAEPAPRARWSWLRFWRRPAAKTPAPTPPGPTPGPPAPPAPDPSPPSPTPQPGPPRPPDPNPPQIRAVLDRVLDDLGQAHHRPFSRS